MLNEAELWVVPENGVPTVKCSTLIGRVVATGVYEEVAVNNAVAGLQLDWIAARGLRDICEQLSILFVRVQTTMAPRDDPEDAVVVERHVPLRVPRAVLDEVGR